MPAQRLSMRHIRAVLRLKWAGGLSDRTMAQILQISRPTVAEYARRAQAAGLSWPLPPSLDALALARRLFATTHTPSAPKCPPPDWPQVHRALRRKGVTLFLLWQEDQAVTPEGVQYSQCCAAYRQWAGTLALVMRQSHRAGETLFVDYAGQTIPVVNPRTEEGHDAALFIAVLGASNSTYAEAPWSQALPDWIGSHVRTFAALGGVPEGGVPDHLKAAVQRAHRDAPALNRTYAALAQHYGFAVLPARAARPRDQAKVEGGVHIVERWLLARLRHHPCFALAEVNTAITALRAELNARPFKKLPGSRQSVFESVARPTLQPLPPQPYEYAAWKLVRVHIDYQVEVDGHYYSVPYSLVRQQLEVRLTAQIVAIFSQGRRVARHQRSPHTGRHSTVAAPRPTAHRDYAAWTPQRLIRWAAHTGEATAQVVETILRARAHPQQGFRAWLGLMRLGTRYGASRLEAACRRALTLRACSDKSIESMRKHDLDQQPLPAMRAAPPAIPHGNIRGPQYSHDSRGDS